MFKAVISVEGCKIIIKKIKKQGVVKVMSFVCYLFKLVLMHLRKNDLHY